MAGWEDNKIKKSGVRANDDRRGRGSADMTV
jgi:hypothetical protein